jgi:Arabidopsis protein of unknown function
MNNLLGMSSNQNSLSHAQERRLVDQELEESIKLIDICSTSRDNLDVIKTHIEDLESAVRRGDSEAMKSRVRYYNLLVKKANRNLKMQIYKKNESASGESLAIVSLLLKSREITHSLLQSIFHSYQNKLSGQRAASGLLYLGYLKRRLHLKMVPWMSLH